MKPEHSEGYEELGRLMGKLVGDKNTAYGDSFGQIGNIMRVLYPDGIKVEQYDDMLCIVRIIDKLFRIATAKDAFGESPYGDIAGYSLLGLMKDRRKKLKETK